MFVLPAWIWLVAVAIASLRDDVFNLGGRARQLLARPAVFGFTVSLYLLLFGTVLLVLRAFGVGFGRWLVPPAFLLLAVVLVEPLRRLSRSLVARAMNSATVLPPRVLRDLTAEIASSLDAEAIGATVLSLGPRLGISTVRLFLAERDGWIELGGDHHLARLHPLVRALERASAELTRDGLDGDGGAERSEVAAEALGSLGLEIVFPLRFRDRCLGFVGFGETARGGPVSVEDRAALAALAGQIAVALENARGLDRIRDLERQLRAENVVLKEALAAEPGIGGLVGQGPAMRRVLALIEQVAPTDSNVLLRGETGAGKELVARAIHVRSLRRDRPMIRVNCAAVPAGLLESEFFGHEKGAFTGAVARKIGRFELADGGTIFLDEIGDLPLELQPKLLRVLQEREFERVGGSTPVRVDVRVIAATNRDLESQVRQGRFRQDLFFRLNVLPVTVPPLRERRDDIPALVAHFLERHGTRLNRRVTRIDERTLAGLGRYAWPGNVRELENLIERALVVAAGDVLRIPEIEAPEAAAAGVGPPRPLSDVLREAKLRAIRRALAETEGNQAHAAQLLGLKPSSLSRMMRNLGMRAR
jgi:formate hydrogenlyase transcriptional activator